MNEKEKVLIYLDSFDFLTYKKKEKLLQLVDLNELSLSLVKSKTQLLEFLTDNEIEILQKNLNQNYIDALFKDFEKLKIEVLTLFSPNYPQNLKNIGTPPFVLYFRGDKNLLNTSCFAIVGSRHITSYGKMVTEKFTKDLVKANFTIVSGLASGVDTVAHATTIAQNGKTIAVLAGGLDDIYPATNINLFKQILSQKGLVLSEVRPLKKTESYMFPIRNRIIAGLSRGILVTEAQEKSGVIHTKNYALDYGKDVFAVPGSIFSSSSVGANLMITNGQAKAVSSASDILCEYGIDLTKETKIFYNYSFDESVVINLLTRGEKTFQELVNLTKFEIKTLNSLLTTLLIRGIIKKLAGNIYFLNS